VTGSGLYLGECLISQPGRLSSRKNPHLSMDGRLSGPQSGPGRDR
jgi:hypothetical protein